MRAAIGVVVHRFKLWAMVSGSICLGASVPSDVGRALERTDSPIVGISAMGAHGVEDNSSETSTRAASARNTQHALQAARALILDQMRDPAGARFRNARVLQGGEVVCLEVAGGDMDFAKAVVIMRPDRAPAVWIYRARELVAHTACEVA